MLLNAMAQLIVRQAQRLGRLPLVPAMLAQSMLDNCPLMRIDRTAQIVDCIERRRGNE